MSRTAGCGGGCGAARRMTALVEVGLRGAAAGAALWNGEDQACR